MDYCEDDESLASESQTNSVQDSLSIEFQKNALSENNISNNKYVRDSTECVQFVPVKRQIEDVDFIVKKRRTDEYFSETCPNRIQENKELLNHLKISTEAGVSFQNISNPVAKENQTAGNQVENFQNVALFENKEVTSYSNTNEKKDGERTDIESLYSTAFLGSNFHQSTTEDRVINVQIGNCPNSPSLEELEVPVFNDRSKENSERTDDLFLYPITSLASSYNSFLNEDHLANVDAENRQNIVYLENMEVTVFNGKDKNNGGRYDKEFSYPTVSFASSCNPSVKEDHIRNVEVENEENFEPFENMEVTIINDRSKDNNDEETDTKCSYSLASFASNSPSIRKDQRTSVQIEYCQNIVYSKNKEVTIFDVTNRENDGERTERDSHFSIASIAETNTDGMVSMFVQSDITAYDKDVLFYDNNNFKETLDIFKTDTIPKSLNQTPLRILTHYNDCEICSREDSSLESTESYDVNNLLKVSTLNDLTECENHRTLFEDDIQNLTETYNESDFSIQMSLNDSTQYNDRENSFEENDLQELKEMGSTMENKNASLKFFLKYNKSENLSQDNIIQNVTKAANAMERMNQTSLINSLTYNYEDSFQPIQEIFKPGPTDNILKHNLLKDDLTDIYGCENLSEENVLQELMESNNEINILTDSHNGSTEYHVPKISLEKTDIQKFTESSNATNIEQTSSNRTTECNVKRNSFVETGNAQINEPDHGSNASTSQFNENKFDMVEYSEIYEETNNIAFKDNKTVYTDTHQSMVALLGVSEDANNIIETPVCKQSTSLINTLTKKSPKTSSKSTILLAKSNEIYVLIKKFLENIGEQSFTIQDVVNFTMEHNSSISYFKAIHSTRIFLKDSLKTNALRMNDGKYLLKIPLEISTYSTEKVGNSSKMKTRLENSLKEKGHHFEGTFKSTGDSVFPINVSFGFPRFNSQ